MTISKIHQPKIKILLYEMSRYEIYLWTTLSGKWFAQRTQVRFRHHFPDALPTTTPNAHRGLVNNTG